MKRFLLILLVVFVLCNLYALVLNIRDFGINWNMRVILSIHYEVSIYALKAGVLAAVYDRLTKRWFEKNNKSKFNIRSIFIERKSDFNLMIRNMFSYVPINNWSWYIYEINAIDNGKSPIDLNVLNKELADSAEGYYLSWEELKELLTSLVEIKNCLIIALKQKEDYQDVVKDDFVDFLCLIKIKDGNSCEIKLNKSLIEEKSDSDNL